MSSRRIGVIGAGPAGLATAMYLIEAGADQVTVLEKRDRIGGKCCTVQAGDRSFDMGANYLTPSYKRTLAIAKKVGATIHPAPSRLAFDVANGTWNSLIRSVLSSVNPFSFVLATLRYVWKSIGYRHFSAAPGFDGIGSMPELHKSLGEWLDDNKMSALRRLFTVPIEIFGYGYLHEVPVPYVFKYMSTRNFLLMVAVGAGLPVRWPKQFDHGFQDFWQKVVDEHGIDVRTGVSITRVDRSGPVTVQTEAHGTFEFDELVIACPPAAILDVTTDRTAEEHDLFAAVQHRDYWVTSAEAPGMPDHLIDEIQMAPAPTLPPKGHPWGISKMWSDSDTVLYYSLVDHKIDADEVYERIKSDSTEMGAPPGPVTNQKRWVDYFPHVPVEQFANQWYERAERMQGQRRTWYSGGLFAFELVEPILGYAYDLVERMAASKPDRADAKVAVIGAGPAGLSAGWFLREAGYGSVEVLEASDRVGGKCDSLHIDGRAIDIGAYTLSPAYEETLRLANHVGARLTEQPKRLAWDMDRESVEPIRRIIFRDANFFSVGWASLRYLFVQWRYRKLLDPPGFAGLATSRHADDLTMNFGDWLSKHRLGALEDMFEMVVPDMGYGRLDEIGTIYVLKYLNTGNFITLARVGLGISGKWPKRFENGFGEMWQRVGATLDVRTSAHITGIQRNEASVTITIDDGNTTTEHHYDHLVIACALNDIVDALDASDEERRIAGQVLTRDYRVFVAKTIGVPHQILDAVHDLRPGEPWEILHPWPELDVTTFYVGETDGHTNDQLQASIAAITPQVYPGASVESFVHDQTWKYFPHFSNEDVRAGIYDDFEHLQGTNRTVYVGSLLAFETVESTVEYSKAAISGHFPGAP